MTTSYPWQKSSFSGSGDGNACVELADTATGPLLRESDDPARVLAPAPTALASLLRHIQNGIPAT
jgi:hypothetical protein